MKTVEDVIKKLNTIETILNDMSNGCTDRGVLLDEVIANDLEDLLEAYKRELLSINIKRDDAE